MKITYLGTAAAEGFPGVFCNCEYCREARQLGGKNIRTRSQTLINDDLLIDLPADTYSHFLNNNIEGDTIKYLLLTHSHSDHFYPDELAMRYGAYAHNMRVDRLRMYCSADVAKKIKDVEGSKNFTIDLFILNPFDSMKLEDYEVTALPAKHNPESGPLIYIIKGERTILYAHDTVFFYDDVFDYIKNTGLVFDLISIDCTNIDIAISDNGRHMGIDNIGRLIEKLEEIGAVNVQTQKVINHFSHNACPIHHKLEERVSEYGYIVAYDSLSIKI